MSRLREYLIEQKRLEQKPRPEHEVDTACKMTYQEFRVALRDAPPPLVSIPDYQAKFDYLTRHGNTHYWTATDQKKLEAQLKNA